MSNNISFSYLEKSKSRNLLQSMLEIKSRAKTNLYDYWSNLLYEFPEGLSLRNNFRNLVDSDTPSEELDLHTENFRKTFNALLEKLNNNKGDVENYETDKIIREVIDAHGKYLLFIGASECVHEKVHSDHYSYIHGYKEKENEKEPEPEPKITSNPEDRVKNICAKIVERIASPDDKVLFYAALKEEVKNEEIPGIRKILINIFGNDVDAKEFNDEAIKKYYPAIGSIFHTIRIGSKLINDVINIIDNDGR